MARIERAADQEFRLAVMRPRDLTEDQGLGWFCEGLAEEVQLALSRLERVVGAPGIPGHRRPNRKRLIRRSPRQHHDDSG